MTVTRHQAAGAFRRWEPPRFDARPESSSLDSGLSPPEDALPLSPPEPEPTPILTAPPQEISAPPPSPAIHLPTVEEVERIHDEAHKEGYAAGYEEGTARGRMEALRLNTLVENMDGALLGLDAEVAEELLTLAIEIARQMVRREFRNKPANIVEIVREALQQLPQNHAMIHLHPEDAGLVRGYLGEQLAHVGNRIIEDERISQGGCRIEAAGSQIDATMQTRWRRIMENLGRGDTAWDVDSAA
ncbi:MAG: flagellar assembly protein FliH [Zoogloeaceae bacterium]|nr:flagellar assembly protein FliH [Zoogloeaceae bacterium]